MSHVAVSFETPEYGNADGLGTYVFDAVRFVRFREKTVFQASTLSVCTGSATIRNNPFYPRSPYAVAKMYAFWITVNYREAYGMYACNGILFNHESLIRGKLCNCKITRADFKNRLDFGINST
jgi:GDPmannose 4,6-dehydratase